MVGEKKLVDSQIKLNKIPIIFSLGAFLILSVFLGLLITQRKIFYPKKNFHTFIRNANGLDIRPRVYFKGIDVGRVTGFRLTKENKIKVDFYILKKFLKNISKNTILMTEENLLTGDIDRFNLATEFSIVKTSWDKIKFIPWEHSPEGEKLKENFKLDFSGNQISVIINQLSTIFSNMDKKELSDGIRGIVLNTEKILRNINQNKIPNKVGGTIFQLKKLIISLRQLVDNYKNPKSILLKMTDPNLRGIFKKIENSLTHLAGILEKVHENKNEIGPLLENLNVVLREVKEISRKLNRVELFNKNGKKRDPLDFEIDN